MKEKIGFINKVDLAYAHYYAEQYEQSLEIFAELGTRLGLENFRYNLKKIHQASSYEELDSLKLFRDVRLFWQKPSTSSQISVSPAGVKLEDVWDPAAAGVSITLQPQREEIDYTRKLLVVPTFYSNGAIIDEEYVGFSHSKSFKNYKYLEKKDTSYAVQVDYPTGVDHVELDVQLFNLSDEHHFNVVVGRRFSSEHGVSLQSAAYENILQMARNLPDSNGSRYYKKISAVVGVIADIYMYNFYKDVFTEVIYLKPDDIDFVLGKNKFDLIIYTTCWKGIDDEEWRGLKFRDKPKSALEKILQHCKRLGVKTVFQSIEDPSNYDYFLPVAKQFDYIFTSDVDCIEKYVADCGHDRVFYGEYGANPQLNNPIGSRRFIDNAAFFAGSYPVRYQERCQDMQIVLSSVTDSGEALVVADRNFGSNDASVSFPAEFSSYVVPPIEHSLLQKVHKLFRYNLNFNSIKDSPTMCAMRVYELQAQGCYLISNYADSVFNKFPNVRTIPQCADLSFDFGREESWYEYYLKVLAIRNVMSNRTSYDVVGALLNNIDYKHDSKPQAVTVAVLYENDELAESVACFIDTQTYSSLIAVNVKTIMDWSQYSTEHAVGYFIWFNKDFSYGRYFIQDLVNAFKYTNQDYITKGSYFLDGQLFKGIEHEYTSVCRGKSLSLFSSLNISPSHLSHYGLVEDFPLENGYTIDPFELNFRNFAVPITNVKADSSQYVLSVIVPVYNNGIFLVTKCFPSLLRNRQFENFEILLVDDGTTEPATLDYLEDLRVSFSNVKVIHSQDAGSGSASRPRNIGIDLASAPLITFLDPDNEISPGGYDNLIQLYHEQLRAGVCLDFISGYHLKVSDKATIIGRHSSESLKVLKDFRSVFFSRGKFPVIPTQPAVIAKSFFDRTHLRFVEGSAGQDTLFGWELIARASVGAFTNDTFLIYYANRNDSITNVIDSSYFTKKVILEKAQVKFLNDFDIMDFYLKHHFDRFLENWYLVKLKATSNSDRDQALKMVEEICRLYGKDFSNYSHLFL